MGSVVRAAQPCPAMPRITDPQHLCVLLAMVLLGRGGMSDVVQDSYRRASRTSPQTGELQDTSSVTAKVAHGNVAEELFVLILLLCSLVPLW